MLQTPIEPIAEADPISMATLIESIQADAELSDARRRNVASSIRRLCGALDIALAEAPAAFWFLRERLAQVHPAQAGIKPHRWQTIQSDVAFALKRIGLAPDQPKPRVDLSEEWANSLQHLDQIRRRHWGLSRLARYCDGRGIAPAAVDDAVMADFLSYLRTQTLKTKPERALRDVCVLWNRLASDAEDIALQEVTLPDNRRTYLPDWEAVPPSLRREIEDWLASMSKEADLLSETGPLRPLHPASVASYRYALRQAIAGLMHSGRPLETITSLGMLVEPRAVEGALEFHRIRMGVKQSQMLAQKTRRGLRGRVEAGFSGGGNSYGYRVVRRFLADGTAVNGEREIEPLEAEIVRRIFDEYAAGHPPRTIVAGLKAEGIPGPRGGAWNASTVNGSRQRRNGILNNELYLGRLIWNRQHFVKDPETGKRISRLNPEAEWITTEVPELRIIDDETWARVQELKSRYAGWAGNTRQTRKRLLSGLAVCACCGGSMTIARRDRYYCATRREKGTCDASHGIAAANLEARVLGGLQRLLVGNEALLDAFAEAFRQELARLRGSRQSDATKLRRDLAETERGIARCLDYILSSDTPPASVRSKLQDLEADKTRLEAELAGLEADLPSPAIEIHPNLPELYRRRVAKLAELLENQETRPEAMEAIRGLIDRIEVGPPETTRGPCRVTLVGALASVLAFVSEDATMRNRRALVGHGGYAFGTTLLVAGA